MKHNTAITLQYKPFISDSRLLVNVTYKTELSLQNRSSNTNNVEQTTDMTKISNLRWTAESIQLSHTLTFITQQLPLISSVTSYKKQCTKETLLFF